MKFLFRPASLTQVTHFQRLWLYVLNIFTMLFLIVPTLIVIPMSFSGSEYLEFPPRHLSFRWYENYFGSPEWMRATLISFNVAIFTMLCSTTIGTAAAYGLSFSKGRFKPWVWSLFALPIAIPVILLAVGSLFVFAKLGLVNSIFALILMHTTLALPFVIIVMTAGLASYDMNQEQAARSLGATRLYAFFTVTLPQIKFSMISAMLFSFFTSFDEVVIAMFISTGSQATLNRRIFNALRDQVDPTIGAISTCLLAVTICLMIVGQIFKPRTDNAG